MNPVSVSFLAEDWFPWKTCMGTTMLYSPMEAQMEFILDPLAQAEKLS
jgi:hypothetical protein